MFKVLPRQITLSVITPWQDKRGPRIATILSQLTGNVRDIARTGRVALTGSSTGVAALDQSNIAIRWLPLSAQDEVPKRAGFSAIFHLYIVKIMLLARTVTVKRRFCDANSQAIANGTISRSDRAQLRLFTPQTRIFDGLFD
jgi:hypothetical protein